MSDENDNTAPDPDRYTVDDVDVGKLVRHDLRNCLNNLGLTMALQARAPEGQRMDPEVIESIQEEIREMSRILDVLEAQAAKQHVE